jgi:molecular chaperone GrpE
MTEAKGPKLDLPDELAAELEGMAEADNDASDAGDPGPGQATTEPPKTDDDPEDLEGLRALLEQTRDRYLRLAADFENTKRRNLKERQDLFNYGNENLIKELLPVVDNLERALGHTRRAEEGEEAQALVEGVELTHRSLLMALEKFGVQRVEALGAEFDPQVHEAVRQVPSAEHPPGRVLEVFQTGYLLKDRLLRPALVTVAGQAEPSS